MGDLFDFDEVDESIERVLALVAECHVYKIPPRASAEGHKCADPRRVR